MEDEADVGVGVNWADGAGAELASLIASRRQPSVRHRLTGLCNVAQARHIGSDDARKAPAPDNDVAGPLTASSTAPHEQRGITGVAAAAAVAAADPASDEKSISITAARRSSARRAASGSFCAASVASTDVALPLRTAAMATS
jgi:hypothetical protein